MKAALIRTGSVPVKAQFPHVSDSPRVRLNRSESLTGIFSGDKYAVNSPKVSLHFEINRRRNDRDVIRRALSETDLIRSETKSSVGSRSFPTRIPEEDESTTPLSRTASFSAISTEIGISGGGFGEGSKSGGSGGGGGGDFGFGAYNDRSKLGEYYQEMLKSNPGDSLLLRNYGKYLHEVEKDLVKAEEYYGRAILANPGDGELLSLYGNLIWETNRDEDRAKSYFDQAITASPHDCTVLGSFAHFMWEAEEEEEENDDDESQKNMSSLPLVSAF
ncbi:hypothetical protein F8388_008478 [Cannabis sativa]|uniref:Uncharacterized protein n=1 Tax=Cannabis sativa TaxID=3483 RepID=A0A7J6EJU6_CANSA|nr:hypothetical protein F8388_008478 [Cannabis sativa]KAF4404382.1 hypothetical protein G4B88_014838 [Cannabis sativa]